MTAFRLGLVLALMNLLTFVAITALKQPDYARLEQLDTFIHGGTTGDLSSAEPLYLAARPFDSPAHVPDVPLIETAYFLVNMPAMFAAFVMTDVVEFQVFSSHSPFSSSRNSWLLAFAFALCAMVQAFVIGVGIGWIRKRVRGGLD